MSRIFPHLSRLPNFATYDLGLPGGYRTVTLHISHGRTAFPSRQPSRGAGRRAGRADVADVAAAEDIGSSKICNVGAIKSINQPFGKCKDIN